MAMHTEYLRHGGRTMFIWTLRVILVGLILCCLGIPNAFAELATQAEMRLVCENWLSYMVHEQGNWAGVTSPSISAVSEIALGDTVLARCFHVSPQGFIVVPVLKELPPVKAYSDECNLDTNSAGGLSALIRDVLIDRARPIFRGLAMPKSVPPACYSCTFAGTFRGCRL